MTDAASVMQATLESAPSWLRMAHDPVLEHTVKRCFQTPHCSGFKFI